jgi:hypothetical protein
MTDWELTHWVLQPLYAWAGLEAAFNPDGAIAKCWVAAVRAGHYPGRPRTADRPYGGEGDAAPAGWWSEFEQELLIAKADGTLSWTG